MKLSSTQLQMQLTKNANEISGEQYFRKDLFSIVQIFLFLTPFKLFYFIKTFVFLSLVILTRVSTK